MKNYDSTKRGTRVTDLIQIEKIQNVPIAMFVGAQDTLATVADSEWTLETIGKAVFHYQVISGGHSSFLVGKDMSYFTSDVMKIIS